MADFRDGTSITNGKIDDVQTDVTAVKAVTDVLPDAGVLTSIAQKAELDKVPKSDAAVTWNATAAAQLTTQSTLSLTNNNLDHLQAVSDGVNNYPNTAVNGSIVAKLISKTAAGADITTYSNVTDSQEMISDKIGAYAGTAGAGAGESAKADLDLVKAQTDKLAGATPTVGSTTANWNTATGTSGEAGEDLVTIGANDTKNKLLSLLLDVSACTDGALLTVKMFTQINGTERKVYSQSCLVNTDPDGLWIVQGVVGIHEALRVEVYSNTNESVAIGYDFLLEVM